MSFARCALPGSVASKLVIDANAAANAALVEDAFAGWEQITLHAPSLIWSEASSALSQMRWRGELTAEQTSAAIDRLLAAPITALPSRELLQDALQFARLMGWAKTYDAEYCVLAQRLDCRLLTIDRRLANAVDGRLVTVSPEVIEREVGAGASSLELLMEERGPR
jgi:predicted nucleic acid-binding protein